MRRGRIITGTITSVAAGLIAVSSAFAATPSEIAKDLADGQMNGTYTQQELENYLKNATVQGYPPGPETPQQPTPSGGGENPVTSGVSETPGAGGEASAEQQTEGVAGVQTSRSGSGSPATGSASPSAGVAGQQSPLAETAQVGTLPFTGLDLGLLVIGGVLLLAIGLGARRVGSRA